MGEESKISWTDATWNTIVGCSKVSEGCHNCYAESLALRYKWSEHPWAERYAAENVKLKPNKLDLPFRWKEPKRVFVNSLSDVFHPLVPFEYIDKMFAVMALSPQHTFQILTKRPERMREYMTADDRKLRVVIDALDEIKTTGPGKAAFRAMQERAIKEGVVPKWPLENVWLGTSVENARWRNRIDELRQTPAAVRFLSCEPLLGSMTDWSKVEVEPHELGRTFFDLTGIDWVIVGGESGPKRRPYDMAWAREIRDACVAKGTGFFYKQSAAFRSGHHPYLTEEDGTCWEWKQDPGVLTPPTMVHDVTGCEDAGLRQEAMAL